MIFSLEELKLIYMRLIMFSKNNESQLNELIEGNLVSNNLNTSNANNDKSFKFLEDLNNDFNYTQKKSLFQNVNTHYLTKDEFKFNEKEKAKLNEKGFAQIQFKYF